HDESDTKQNRAGADEVEPPPEARAEACRLGVALIGAPTLAKAEHESQQSERADEYAGRCEMHVLDQVFARVGLERRRRGRGARRPPGRKEGHAERAEPGENAQRVVEAVLEDFVRDEEDRDGAETADEDVPDPAVVVPAEGAANREVADQHAVEADERKRQNN